MTTLAPRIALAAGLLVLSSGLVLAQSSDRYSMSPVDGGFVRLDKETGAMSMCSRKDEGWSCTPMSDETELSDEVARLRDENKALQDEVRRLEDTFIGGTPKGESRDSAGAGGPPGGLPPGGLPKLELPTEDQVDQAVDYLERMIRKFRERFEDFGDKTDPDRTPGGQGNQPDNRETKPTPQGTTPL